VDDELTASAADAVAADMDDWKEGAVCEQGAVREGVKKWVPRDALSYQI
jgi:hypothetical protein